MSKRNCPQCGREAQEGWTMCPRCGAPLPSVAGLSPGAPDSGPKGRHSPLQQWPKRSDPVRALIPRRARVLRIVGLALTLLFIPLLFGGIGLAESTPWAAALLIPLGCVSLIAGLVLLILSLRNAGIKIEWLSGCLVVLVVAGAVVSLLVAAAT
jgi:zinc-ribbon domain